MAYTNPTNIFNFVPHAVTQWKISAFLTPEERAAFNAVLEPTERIFKRFPKDFAIKHSLRILCRAQRNYAVQLIDALDNSNIILRNEKLVRKTMRLIKNYVRFISSQARLIYQYRTVARDTAFRELRLFLDDEFPYEPFVTDDLREMILGARNVLDDTPFVREVNL
jgi:hypothetical protein